MLDQKLGGYSICSDYTSISGELIQKTKKVILLTIGRTIAAVKDRERANLFTRAIQWLGTNQGHAASILGSGFKDSAEQVFSVNNRRCGRYDRAGHTHPGRQMILAAVAAAEKLQMPIKFNDFAGLVLTSYEAMLRIGHALREVAWSPSDKHPRPEYTAHSCTVPGLATIVSRLSEINTISLSTVSKMAMNANNTHYGTRGLKNTALGVTVSDKNRMNLAFLAQVFHLLRSYETYQIFSTELGDRVINEVSRFVNTEELTVIPGQEFLAESIGLCPTNLDFYLHCSLSAMIRAIIQSYANVNSLGRIVMRGPHQLFCVTEEEIANHLATALEFISLPVEPETLLVLNGRFSNASIELLAKKVEFEEERPDWSSMLVSGKFTVSAKVYYGNNRSEESSVVGAFPDAVDYDPADYFQRLISRTLGSVKARGLYEKSMNDDAATILDLIHSLD